MNKTKLYEAIEKAWYLIFFIHETTDYSATIIEEALQALPGSINMQSERFRKAPKGFRKKPIFSEAQLFQLRILERSAIFEKIEERRGTILTRDMFLRRYLKFLLQETLPCSPFRVNTALCRFVHGYDNRETADIFHALLEESKTDQFTSNFWLLFPQPGS